MTNLKEVEIYIDGACSGNPGPGGWGVYMQYKNTEKKLFGSEANTTNNRMEVMAAIMAFKALKEKCDIKIYTDSVYLKDGITSWIHKWILNNWMRGTQPVKNVDLWQELFALSKLHNISWNWVKGHAGHYGNEIADQLARQGRDAAKLN